MMAVYLGRGKTAEEGSIFEAMTICVNMIKSRLLVIFIIKKQLEIWTHLSRWGVLIMSPFFGK